MPVRSSCRTSLAARNVKRSCVADVIAARILPICGLAQHHIHHHHQDEADGKADRGEVGVGALSGLGDEFLHDHTLAATITPLAKPSSVFCILSGISFFMKKTKAEPSIVPSSGSSIPMIMAFITLIFHAAKMHIFCQIGIPINGYFAGKLSLYG